MAHFAEGAGALVPRRAPAEALAVSARSVLPLAAVAGEDDLGRGSHFVLTAALRKGCEPIAWQREQRQKYNQRAKHRRMVSPGPLSYKQD